MKTLLSSSYGKFTQCHELIFGKLHSSLYLINNYGCLIIKNIIRALSLDNCIFMENKRNKIIRRKKGDRCLLVNFTKILERKENTR